MTQEKSQENQATIDEEKLMKLFEEMRANQNLPMALIAGLISSTIGAIIWAVITVVTEYQIGYMAIAVGFLVGISVRKLGGGVEAIFGYVGAVFALLGCLGGNLLSFVGFIGIQESIMPYFEVLSRLDLEIIIDIYKESFSPMDLLFYGIAIYEGYRFSFKQITEEQVVQMQS